MVQNGTEWVPFQMNVPHASHMSGSWERMIRTVRSALERLLMSSGDQLDDEALRTFMTEVECIVNSSPLAVNELSDPEILEPLTPNHLLTLKPKSFFHLRGNSRELICIPENGGKEFST